MGFSLETEKIINQLSHQLEQVADGNVPTDFECGTLFQYVFDKVTEALYKLLMGDEVDTQFNLQEAFDYNEPDLPEHIQLKLTNVVGKTSWKTDDSLAPSNMAGVENKLRDGISVNLDFDSKEVYIGSANLTGACISIKTENKRNFEAGILTDDHKIVEQAMN